MTRPAGEPAIRSRTSTSCSNPARSSFDQANRSADTSTVTVNAPDGLVAVRLLDIREGAPDRGVSVTVAVDDAGLSAGQPYDGRSRRVRASGSPCSAW